MGKASACRLFGPHLEVAQFEPDAARKKELFKALLQASVLREQAANQRDCHLRRSQKELMKIALKLKQAITDPQ